MTRWQPVCCQSRSKIKAGPTGCERMTGRRPCAWSERIMTEWARRAPEIRRASSWPLSRS